MTTPAGNPQIPRRPRPRPGVSRALRWCMIAAMTLESGTAVASVIIGISVWDPARPFTSMGLALQVAMAIVLMLIVNVQYRAVFRRRIQATTWAALIHLMAGVGSLMAAAGLSVSMNKHDTSEWLGIAFAIALGLFFLYLTTQMLRWSNQLIEYHTFKPFCGPCGYNLIGSIVAGAFRCPECGAVIPYEKIARHGPPRSQEIVTPEPAPDSTH